MKTSVCITIFLLLLFCRLTAQTPAFPGAEGGGMYTTGGRGGKVIYVTNLEDDGKPGSLRYAINQAYPRIIVFKVSGIIKLQKRLFIKNGDLTIAGQTAPGDGICIRDHNVTVDADNVIVRFLRFRMGDETQEQTDAFSGKNRKNIIIDHCSMSWSIDECASFYSNENFTMQWCLIAESLNKSFHDKADHGYGAIWGGKNASFHHNLLAHHNSRNPRFNGWKRAGLKYTNILDEELVDYRNNVIYNWGNNSAYGGESQGKYNIVANYYKYGPGTKSSIKSKILQVDMDPDTINYPPGTGQFYVTDNYVFGNPAVTKNNWNGGVTYAKDANQTACRADKPFPYTPVSQHTAEKAYEKVLQLAGASLSRDIIDVRITEEVKKGTATFSGSKTGKPGIIDSQTDVGGWPEYKQASLPVDQNEDGVPDHWMETHFPGKKANDVNNEGYTYLEVYLNSLVENIITKGYKDVTAQIKTGYDFVVAPDGSGNGKTIQSAFDAVPGNGSTFSIYVKNGKYEERPSLTAGKSHVNLIGQNRDSVIISAAVYSGLNGATTSTTQTLEILADYFHAENLTVENTAGVDAGQAVALKDFGRHNCYRNVRLLGHQDTHFTGDNSIQHYQDCEIRGTVDFIFGGGDIFFENCLLYCIGRKNPDVVVAPSTLSSSEHGYVFYRCTIDGDQETQNNRFYLGRPWKNEPRAVFIHTTLKIIPHPAGWNNMGVIPQLFAEYDSHDSSGNPIDLSQRKNEFTQSEKYGGKTVGGLQTVLSENEAIKYTR